MEIVSKCLKRKLPSELYGKVEAYAHDLRPVMKELLQKRRPKIPYMLISFEKIEHASDLRRRYKDDIHTIGKRIRFDNIQIPVQGPFHYRLPGHIVDLIVNLLWQIIKCQAFV